MQAQALEQQSQHFWHQGPMSQKTVFPPTGDRGQFGDDPRALHLLCTLSLSSLISSPSDHQALDSRGWGPPLWRACSPHRPEAGLLYRDLSSGEQAELSQGSQTAARLRLQITVPRAVSPPRAHCCHLKLSCCPQGREEELWSEVPSTSMRPLCKAHCGQVKTD